MPSFARFLALAGTLLVRPAQFLLYAVSGLVPRRAELWVFGSWGGHRYADNSAAFFEYCRERTPRGVELVWISHDPGIVSELRSGGHEAHWWWSPRGMWRCLRAGLHLFDCFPKDTNYWLSRGARRVNLWSGVPLKTFERDIDNPRNRYYRLFHGNPLERFFYGVMMPWHVTRPDLIIATSQETKAITAGAFAVPDEAVVVTGFPRNDALFDGATHGSPSRPYPPAVQAALDAGKRVFLYLPTFRDSAKAFLDIDWARLSGLMDELDAVFVIKFHPMDKTEYAAEHANIIQLFQDTDVYDVLPATRALISDYSSIIFDYMLLARPIVYYTPDLEEFVASSRALNFDPREIAVGPVCRTSEELFDALRGAAEDSREPRVDDSRRTAVVARLHDHVDDRACERVLDVLQQRFLSSAPQASRQTLERALED